MNVVKVNAGRVVCAGDAGKHTGPPWQKGSKVIFMVNKEEKLLFQQIKLRSEVITSNVSLDFPSCL